ncbi:hypothetical protein ALC56_13815 [Trachymyrmex septentrionalis]|uniref:Uncharacterized protein n=1 Tax=Trachymyrmex septentrionalis TaxID=34720 RepID=A0A195EU45_9HYME|nr:hypothetical protein ALC56_13815 [Trachymyrmex septentrionalis]
MCDDDEDRAAGTIEVTRGGDDSWGTERYQGSQDAAGEKVERRKISQCRIARSPRIGHDRLVGPMTGHDDLTARVARTLTSRSRPLLTTLTTLLVALSCCCARASEFPERECCDLPYPIPEPTGRSTSAPTPTGRSGKVCNHQKMFSSKQRVREGPGSEERVNNVQETNIGKAPVACETKVSWLSLLGKGNFRNSVAAKK